MSVSILGIGTVSATGCGLDAFRAGLEGTTKPAIQQRNLQVPAGPVSVPYYEAKISGLEKFAAPGALRRMSRFSQMALLASHLAVQDSGMEVKGTDRVGIIFGTAYGPVQAGFAFLDSLIDGNDSCPSPTAFATSVHNSLASLVSISMKLQGPSLSLSAFDFTGALVFNTARLWMEKQNLDYLLLGLGDECGEIRDYATNFLTSSEGTLEPFRLNSCTHVSGEGFVCLLIGRQDGRSPRLSFETGTGESPLASASQIVFAAANGDKNTGKYYEYLLGGSREIRCFSPLYGSMPVGIAFELAAAVVSLRTKMLYANPGYTNGGANSRPIDGDQEITAIQYDGKGRYLALKLEGIG